MPKEPFHPSGKITHRSPERCPRTHRQNLSGSLLNLPAHPPRPNPQKTAPVSRTACNQCAYKSTIPVSRAARRNRPSRSPARQEEINRPRSPPTHVGICPPCKTAILCLLRGTQQPQQQSHFPRFLARHVANAAHKSIPSSPRAVRRNRPVSISNLPRRTSGSAHPVKQRSSVSYAVRNSHAAAKPFSSIPLAACSQCPHKSTIPVSRTARRNRSAPVSLGARRDLPTL